MSYYPEPIRDVLDDLRHCSQHTEDTAFTASDFTCGTFVRFSLSIDPATREIRRISFKSNCCGYGIAASELLARQLSAKTLAELGGLKDQELADIIGLDLGEVPPERRHCVQTTVAALHGAFAEYRHRRLESYDGDDPLICTCFGVSEASITGAIEKYGLRSVDEVSAVCRAGLGCGSCRMLIQEVIDDISRR